MANMGSRWLVVVIALCSGCHLLLGFHRSDEVTPVDRSARDGRAETFSTRDVAIPLTDAHVLSERPNPSGEHRPDAPKTGDKSRPLDKSKPGEQLPDRFFTPCQLAWANGWSLMGSSGLQCHGSCDGFIIDCDPAGNCSCTNSGSSNPCPTDACETLVDNGCCRW